MFDKIVNRVRSYFSKAADPTVLHGPAIRNTSPSLGRLFRERGVLAHQSNTYTQVEDKNGLPQIVREGVTLNMGRNRFKRACKAAGINRVRAERAILAGASFEDAARA